MSKRIARHRWPQGLLAAACLMIFPAASAAPEFEFDVRSPSVMTIRTSLAERHALLREHYYAGTIGLTSDGMIALREQAGLAPEVLRMVGVLVDEDNKDRDTLYREIARANGRPDWEAGLRGVFAQRWIERAPAGWFYRKGGGEWLRIEPRDVKVPAGGDAKRSASPAAEK